MSRSAACHLGPNLLPGDALRTFAIDAIEPAVEFGTNLRGKDEILRSQALPELVDKVQLLLRGKLGKV
jgi:hypothetical protein